MIDHSLTKWIIKGDRLHRAIGFSPNQLCLKSTVWYWQHFKAGAILSLCLRRSSLSFPQSFFVRHNESGFVSPPKSTHNAKLREHGFRLCGIFVCLFSFFRPVRFGECQPLSDYSNLLLKNLKAGLKLFSTDQICALWVWHPGTSLESKDLWGSWNILFLSSSFWEDKFIK